MRLSVLGNRITEASRQKAAPVKDGKCLVGLDPLRAACGGAVRCGSAVPSFWSLYGGEAGKTEVGITVSVCVNRYSGEINVAHPDS